MFVNHPTLWVGMDLNMTTRKPPPRDSAREVINDALNQGVEMNIVPEDAASADLVAGSTQLMQVVVTPDKAADGNGLAQTDSLAPTNTELSGTTTADVSLAEQTSATPLI